MKKIFKFLTLAMAMIGSLNAQTLNVGTSANYPPFEYIDKNSQITGFDIDLLNELSKKVGFEYKIVNMSFDGIISALKSGKIDAAISAMSATPQRLKAVDFTDPYFVTENLYIKRANNDKISSKDNLVDKKVGTQLGTVQEIAVNKMPGVKSAPTEDIFGSIMALKNGKIDAVLVDSSIGYGYLKKNKDLVAFFKEPDGSEGFSIAFDKNKHTDLIKKINTALKELKDSGDFDKLLEKYNLK